MIAAASSGCLEIISPTLRTEDSLTWPSTCEMSIMVLAKFGSACDGAGRAPAGPAGGVGGRGRSRRSEQHDAPPGRGRPSGKANIWEKINVVLVKQLRAKTLKPNKKKKYRKKEGKKVVNKVKL